MNQPTCQTLCVFVALAAAVPLFLNGHPIAGSFCIGLAFAVIA